ncbi:transcriptional regulatory domain protein [Mycobacterium xenopi 4042]|uniref:Transcriptional regulatory domain protein n=1 Tax=Mycobacterium xenopi 4042 TaxID=1299334 RepID=X7ZW23_MYCXE|nr:transcriptional regulatory domain protein [Mycobacterium xenopi 4042]
MRIIDPATMPLIAELTSKGHRIGVADDINFEYGLNCILDHASRLIEQNAKSTADKANSKR